MYYLCVFIFIFFRNIISCIIILYLYRVDIMPINTRFSDIFISKTTLQKLYKIQPGLRRYIMKILLKKKKLESKKRRFSGHLAKKMYIYEKVKKKSQNVYAYVKLSKNEKKIPISIPTRRNSFPLRKR